MDPITLLIAKKFILKKVLFKGGIALGAKALHELLSDPTTVHLLEKMATDFGLDASRDFIEGVLDVIEELLSNL